MFFYSETGNRIRSIRRRLIKVLFLRDRNRMFRNAKSSYRKADLRLNRNNLNRIYRRRCKRYSSRSGYRCCHWSGLIHYWSCRKRHNRSSCRSRDRLRSSNRSYWWKIKWFFRNCNCFMNRSRILIKAGNRHSLSYRTCRFHTGDRDRLAT